MKSQAISSTLLALNYQRNFEKITKAQNYLICIVDEQFDLLQIREIGDALGGKELGKLLLISQEKESSVFSIIFHEFEKL